MNGRFRKASALLATVALCGGLIAMVAAPAGASSESGCENSCTSGFSTGPTTRTDGPFTLGVQFTTSGPGDLQHMCYSNDSNVVSPPPEDLTDNAYLSNGSTTFGPVAATQSGQLSCAYFYALIPAGTWTVWYDDNSDLYDSGSATGGDLGSPTDVTGVTAVYGSGGMPTNVADNYGVNFTWYSAPNAPSPVAVTPTSSTTATFSFTGDSQAGASTPWTCSASVGSVTPSSGTGTSGANAIPLTGLTPGATNKVTCSVNEVYLGITNGNAATASTFLPPPTPTITTVTNETSSTASVAFGPVAAGATYTVTCTPVPPAFGGTGTGTGSGSPILVTGLSSDVPYSCTVTASFGNGVSSTSAAAFTVVPATSGPGCAGSATAPTNLSAVSMAFPGAVVSWAPVIPNPASCLVGYVVTPTQGSTALTPTFVLGHGTTTNVLNLSEGSSYTFTVAAVTGSGVGPASTPTASVTIGSPAAVTALKVASAGKTAIKVSFKAGRDNGAAITGFVATCGSKSTFGKASPVTVKGLTAGKTYTCTVRAANSRGMGASARSGSVKA